MSFWKNNIKQEVPHEDDDFDDQELEGKIVDYQFLVKPKQEHIDIKPNPVQLELVGEILEAQDSQENESKSNNSDVSYKTKTSRPKAHIDYVYWSPESEVRKNEPPKFFCEYCDFKNHRKSSLVRHYKHVHQGVKKKKETKVLFCKYCDFKTCYKVTLNRHTDKHENKLRYRCTLCDFKGIEKLSIKRHFKNKHTQKEITLICNICGHGSTTKKSHELHSTTHSDERKYNCDLCTYKARFKSNLDEHKNRMHFKKPIEKPIVCDMCGQKFTVQYYLKIHLSTAHGKDVGLQKYICYTCGYETVDKRIFVTHVHKHSKNKEKMYCANCDYSTCIKTNLLQHMVKHNKHVKMHKCNICSFETKRPHTLRNHVKTHLDKE